MPVLSKMIGFLQTSDPERAKRYFGDTLGFALRDEDAYALVFDAHGTMLRVGKAETVTPAQGTVLGWEVEDMHAAVTELAGRGVAFVQFGLSFLQQDDDGVWVAPNGDEVAWFKDPDGNVLSISRHGKK